MTTAERRKALRLFALDTLRIMEQHTYWSADTLQEIMHAAVASRLAKADGEHFKRTSAGKRREADELNG